MSIVHPKGGWQDLKSHALAMHRLELCPPERYKCHRPSSPRPHAARRRAGGAHLGAKGRLPALASSRRGHGATRGGQAVLLLWGRDWHVPLSETLGQSNQAHTQHSPTNIYSVPRVKSTESCWPSTFPSTARRGSGAGPRSCCPTRRTPPPRRARRMPPFGAGAAARPKSWRRRSQVCWIGSQDSVLHLGRNGTGRSDNGAGFFLQLCVHAYQCHLI